MTGRNGASRSGPLLSEGPAPRPPHPWLECIFLRLFIHGFISHKHLSHFVRVGRGGAGSHRGPRLDSVRAGGAEPGSDSSKDRGLPRAQGGLGRRPGCPWLPTPALRSRLGPGHESSLNTSLHYSWSLAGESGLQVLRSGAARWLPRRSRPAAGCRRQDSGGLPLGAPGCYVRNFGALKELRTEVSLSFPGSSRVCHCLLTLDVHLGFPCNFCECICVAGWPDSFCLLKKKKTKTKNWC